MYYNCSLMVEELARWKSALSMHINELQENIKSLLEERTKVRLNSLNTYCDLKELSKHLGCDNNITLNNINILELANASHTLSANIVANLLNIKYDYEEYHKGIADLSNVTRAEAMALKVIFKFY